MIALALAALFGVTHAHAQTIDPQKAAKVKAAYLLNFVRYTQWPETSFEGPGSPIVVTVLGRCDVTDVLSEAVERSEPMDGRALVLRRTEVPRAAGEAELTTFAEGLRGSHLVYFCDMRPEQTRTVLKRLAAVDVLTVGDMPDFAENGGMLGFVLSGDRIMFKANPKAIQTTQVSVSGKVLKLADIVESAEP